MSRRGPAAVAAPVVAALALGALGALADGAGGRATVRPTPAPAPAAPPAPIGGALPPVPAFAPCDRAAANPPAPAPVPKPLLDAFGVLRRDRTDADALPQRALDALRARGLEPFDPAAARLLRTTDDGGRAWVVPVRDAAPRVPPVPCAVAFRPPRPKRLLRGPRALVLPRTAPRLPPPLVTPSRPAKRPAPGLAVVALGGAPAGAGGPLDDLVRGREDVAVDVCGGPGHDMLTVSGIVPDGVAAAFLTSADGTAVRADVKDNAYAFVVARPKRPEQRYVVWTGGDGTPHVQPLLAPGAPRALRCPPPSRAAAVVSPAPAIGCPAVPVVLAPPAAPALIPKARRLVAPAPCAVPFAVLPRRHR